MTEALPLVDNTDIFRQLETYPWDKDKEFQIYSFHPSSSPLISLGNQVKKVSEENKELQWDKERSWNILGGLSAILGSNPSPSQLEDLTLRAQCFYLSRKKSTPIDFDAYKIYLSTKQPPTPISIPEQPPAQTTRPSEDLPPSTTEDMSITETPPAQPNGGAPYPPTFKQIVELIQSGAPIPGIMDIPDTVLTGQGSTPQAPKRRKPWEKEDSEEVAGGTFGDARDEAPIEQELPEDDDVPRLET
ncbi:hypothetical protein LOCC1_G001809 [Lachnellula occidentalis]|uniref:Uncharacterized protein n=1 Tax=Lachnellula occidentalis TaxID=215460 RepID=A0A8H8S652_9HELO|nr:hypothetical protein LOCC1_G001809 [Lachnellula occidentalis]